MAAHRRRSAQIAAFLFAVSTLTASLDPTDAMAAGYHVLRIGEIARKNLMLLYDGVTEALAGIKLQRWIDAVASTLPQGDSILLLQLSTVIVALSIVLKMLLERIADLPPLRQQEPVRVNRQRRYLTAFTDTEEDAGLTLRGRNRSRPHRSVSVLCNEHSLNGLEKFNDEVDAAGEIQHRVHTPCKPWVEFRENYLLRPPSPVEPWMDRETGAVVVTRLDPDFMSSIEQPGEPSLVDVELGSNTSVDALPVNDDGEGTSFHGSSRRRGGAASSLKRLFPSRKQSYGVFASRTKHRR